MYSYSYIQAVLLILRGGANEVTCEQLFSVSLKLHITELNKLIRQTPIPPGSSSSTSGTSGSSDSSFDPSKTVDEEPEITFLTLASPERTSVGGGSVASPHAGGQNHRRSQSSRHSVNSIQGLEAFPVHAFMDDWVHISYHIIIQSLKRVTCMLHVYFNHCHDDVYI